MVTEKIDEPTWPNQVDVVDGVTPVDEVSQDPEAFDLTDDELNTEMEK